MSSAAQIALQLRSTCDTPRIVDDAMVALLPGLRAVILAHEATEPSFPSLNVGGWKSTELFSTWPESVVERFAYNLARDYLVNCRPVCWAMVNRHGASHPRHQHAAAVVSGVYYVDPGDAEHGAPTIFELRNGETLEVAARAGRLVIFRADLWHRVPTYEGHRPRITIAFDVRR